MQHRKKGRKFHREKGQRVAFFKSLMANLILKGKIETTDTRAKEIKSRVEKMVTLAKKQNLASMRLLVSRLPKKAALKLYNDIAPKYLERKGGYTKITKTAKKRIGDSSKVSIIEFV
ncbi:MAG TPA: 50S ribosomal protein L17 [Candidatus Paceibacterota bacterium]|nr:50S ribosomal protein L17 [Candidatus Paceibacterota bacterium]